MKLTLDNQGSGAFTGYARGSTCFNP
jgi:hypothetical protein